jgi:hypothetical protein
MKQLTCEMCGSTDLIKQDGVFVCQTCGTKYSIEEARKMMVEGTVEVTGTVKVDDSAKLENYLNIAKKAAAAGNNEEAEKYCNQILEINPENYEAWAIKGKAAGWQSTLSNDRMKEATKCFLSALEFTPEDEIREMVSSTCYEVKKLCTALVQLCCNNFTKVQTTEVAETLLEKTGNAIILARSYTETETVKKFLELDRDAILEAAKNDNAADEMKQQAVALLNVKWLMNIGGYLADLINRAVVAALSPIRKKYEGRHGVPNEYEWRNFVDAIDICILLLDFAVEIEDSNEDKLQLYKNIICIAKEAMESCSWKYASNDSYFAAPQANRKWVSSDSKYIKEYVLSAQAKASREVKIMVCEAMLENTKALLAKKQAEEHEAKMASYWEKHADEKEQLLSDLESAKEHLTTVQAEKNKVSKAEIAPIERRIASLTTELGTLGMFKGKEKKALQEQIDASKYLLNAEKTKYEKALEQAQYKINTAENNIKLIQAELNGTSTTRNYDA